MGRSANRVYEVIQRFPRLPALEIPLVSRARHRFDSKASITPSCLTKAQLHRVLKNYAFLYNLKLH
jgi:hypothetical protein